MHPKLAWIDGLCGSLGLALAMTITHSVEDTVDPLMKRVILTLEDELGKKDFNPIQKLVHGFANANDCVAHRIYKGRKQLIIDVLTKTRRGPVCNRNPLASDKG